MVTCHWSLGRGVGWEGGWELMITLSNTRCRKTDRQTRATDWTVGCSRCSMKTHAIRKLLKFSLLTMTIIQQLVTCFVVASVFINVFSNYWE